MKKLTDNQTIEYLHRSYTAADGLWFMKIEERFGFDTALDADVDVWRIMPKIQGRMLKEMLKLPEGLEGLRTGIEQKLLLDRFTFSIVPEDSGFTIVIESCPWHELMVKAGRGHLSEHVGDRVCTAEYEVWASEFGENIACHVRERICSGCDACRITFATNGNST